MTDRISRRRLMLSALAASRLAAASAKDAVFPSDWQRFADPSTELEVYRLTSSAYSSTLPAYYNRAISRNSAWMVFCCDRQGSPQAFRMDLRTGETRQLTEAEGLDGASLSLTPGQPHPVAISPDAASTPPPWRPCATRPLYEVPEGWERAPGMSVEPDGTDVLFVERRGRRGVCAPRLCFAPRRGPLWRRRSPSPTPWRAPCARRSYIAGRGLDKLPGSQPSGADGLWLVNSDGRQNRRLKLAAGGLGRQLGAGWKDHPST